MDPELNEEKSLLGIHLTQLRAGSDETVVRTIGFCRLPLGGPTRPGQTTQNDGLPHGAAEN